MSLTHVSRFIVLLTSLIVSAVQAAEPPEQLAPGLALVEALAATLNTQRPDNTQAR